MLLFIDASLRVQAQRATFFAKLLIKICCFWEKMCLSCQMPTVAGQKADGDRTELPGTIPRAAGHLES